MTKATTAREQRANQKFEQAARKASRGTPSAREDAARLAGQLAATQEQTAAILARLAPPAEPKPATTRKKADKGTPAE